MGPQRLNMATTKKRIVKIAKEVLRKEPMPANTIAEVVSKWTKDGVATARMNGLLRKNSDFEKVPETAEPILWRIKQNLDAAETSGVE